MPDTRGDLEVEGLLKIILVLVIIWILVEITIEVFKFLIGPASSVIGLLIVILILLWFFDKI